MTTKFHGIIGDINPIEHNGGVVYDRGHGVEVLYFQGWTDEGEERVTVFRFMVEDDVVADLTWADWDSVASCIGMDVDELKGYGTSDNVLARAQVYESVAAHSGFREMDSQPREMTLEAAEHTDGTFVDQCHAEAN